MVVLRIVVSHAIIEPEVTTDPKRQGIMGKIFGRFFRKR